MRHAMPCRLTDRDVAPDDGGLRLAIDAVLSNMHNHIVLDVGVAAHFDAIHIP